jgi:hydrogenase maturation protease
MKTLILGMGNTLLCDDGIGIIVKRYLEKNLSTLDNVEFRETSWGGFKIIDLLGGFDYAIVIDSIKTGNKPQGYIHRLNPNDLLPTLRLNSYHDINFITALKLAEIFHAKMPEHIDIFAIEVENTDIIAESIVPEIWDSIKRCSLEVIRVLKERKIIQNGKGHPLLNEISTEAELNELYKEDLCLN